MGVQHCIHGGLGHVMASVSNGSKVVVFALDVEWYLMRRAEASGRSPAVLPENNNDHFQHPIGTRFTTMITCAIFSVYFKNADRLPHTSVQIRDLSYRNSLFASALSVCAHYLTYKYADFPRKCGQTVRLHCRTRRCATPAASDGA